MIKQLNLGCFAALSLYGQVSLANPDPSLLFDVNIVSSTSEGPVFQVISKNPYRKCYNFAGVQASSPFSAVSFSTPSSKDCVPDPINHYCLFRVCNAKVTSEDPTESVGRFVYSGPAGQPHLSICSNGKGKKAGCQTKFPGVDVQYAYVVDNGINNSDFAASEGTVWQCPVQPNGFLGSVLDGSGTCTAMASGLPSNSWTAPNKISFTDVRGTEYAYIADGGIDTSAANPVHKGTGSVYICSLIPNNEQLKPPCISNTNDIKWATQVAFATINGIKYAYVSDYGGLPPNHSNATVWRCLVAEDGSLPSSGCVPQYDASFWGAPMGVTIKKRDDQLYAYVSDPVKVSPDAALTGVVVQCALDSNGNFPASSAACTSIVPWRSWKPEEVAFKEVDNILYAYVADNTYGGAVGGGFVWQCLVTPKTGVLENCKENLIGNNIKTVNGITFAIVRSKLYAYLSSSFPTTPNVLRCTLKSDGSGSIDPLSCVITAFGQDGNWAPNGVTILSDAHETAPYR